LKRNNVELDYVERALKERERQRWILDSISISSFLTSKRLKQDLDRFQVLRQKSILMQTHPSLSYSGEGSMTATLSYLRNPQLVFPNAFKEYTLGPFSSEALRDFAERVEMHLSATVSRSI
jgi:hypothetical protein